MFRLSFFFYLTRKSDLNHDLCIHRGRANIYLAMKRTCGSLWVGRDKKFGNSSTSSVGKLGAAKKTEEKHRETEVRPYALRSLRLKPQRSFRAFWPLGARRSLFLARFFLIIHRVTQSTEFFTHFISFYCPSGHPFWQPF